MSNNPKFKIFGERGSGTNLVRYLVANENFLPDELDIFKNKYASMLFNNIGALSPKIYDEFYDIIVKEKIKSIGGWKHSVPDIDLLTKMRVIPVIITKHPTFWLSSFYKKPFHHYRDDNRYMPRRIENLDRRFITLQELIVFKMNSFHEAAKKLGAVLIQYETLIYETADAQKSLRDIFGHCLNMPEFDVRSFVQTEKSTDYRSIYESSRLQGSASMWEHYPQFSDTMDFFGYEAGAWHKTLPFLL